MRTENIRYIAYTVCSVLGIMILGFLFFRYIFTSLLPFVFAWGIAFMARPPAAFLSKRFGLPVGIARVGITLLTSALIFTALGFGLYRVLGEVWRFLSGFAEDGSLSDFLSGYFGSEGLLGSLGEKVGEAIYEIILSFLRSLGGALSGFASAVPRAVLAVLITLIASIYFSLDLERINRFVLDILPERAQKGLKRFKDRFVNVGLSYVRAYLLLMLLTFLILFLGLVILRVPYALLIALGTALLDVLPVLGIGAVLIPWSILSFATGNSFLGFGLLILYGVGSIVRQISEPKIVGKNLGVHPLISLVILYTGYKLLGFFGILLVPFFVTILNVIFNKDDSAKIAKSTCSEGKDD